MPRPGSRRRPWTFYGLAAFFTLYVLFLYGPMSAIFILSFQGPTGGLTFPMNGVSLHWFSALFGQQRTGDFAGSFTRSIVLAVIVLAITVVVSVMAGLAFRRRFLGSTLVFYMAIFSLIIPGLLLGLGVGLMFQFLGIKPAWYSSALGAQLTWTLPFGLLIMFAVFSRFNPFYEEAARDHRGSAVRVHALVRRVPPHAHPDREPQHAAPRDLGDDHQRDLARAVRVGNADHRRILRGDRRRPDLHRPDPAPPHAARDADRRGRLTSCPARSSSAT